MGFWGTFFHPISSNPEVGRIEAGLRPNSVSDPLFSALKYARQTELAKSLVDLQEVWDNSGNVFKYQPLQPSPLATTYAPKEAISYEENRTLNDFRYFAVADMQAVPGQPRPDFSDEVAIAQQVVDYSRQTVG